MREYNFYDWFCGLSNGEGSFYIKSTGSRTFSFRFKIGLHKDNLEMLKFLQKTLGMERIFTYHSRSHFNVTKQQDVTRIIDIFSNYPLNTHKHMNFLDFKKAYEIYYRHNMAPHPFFNKNAIIGIKLYDYLDVKFIV